jgi:lactoylglutathione lyase
MKLGYVIIYVENVAASVAFYQAAFGLTLYFQHDSGDYAAMDAGETKLAFAQHALAGSNFAGGYEPLTALKRPAGMEIGLSVTDVAGAFARAVAAGALALSAPAEKPWGQTVAYVRGLDGELVELCSPM